MVEFKIIYIYYCIEFIEYFQNNFMSKKDAPQLLSGIGKCTLLVTFKLFRILNYNVLVVSQL